MPSPGAILNNQEPDPILPAPAWRQLVKWGSSILFSMPAAVLAGAAVYNFLDRAGANQYVNYLATYLTGLGTWFGCTYTGHEILDRFEGRNRLANAQRDTFHRDEYRRARRADVLAENHRNEVRRLGRY